MGKSQAAPDVGDRHLDRTGAGHADQLGPKRQHGDRELGDQVVETAPSRDDHERHAGVAVPDALDEHAGQMEVAG